MPRERPKGFWIAALKYLSSARNFRLRLAALKEKNMISHIAAQYSGDLIDGAALIIGATDDEKTNARISLDARGKGIPVNIVDDPQKCDFILPCSCAKRRSGDCYRHRRQKSGVGSSSA